MYKPQIVCLERISRTAKHVAELSSTSQPARILELESVGAPAATSLKTLLALHQRLQREPHATKNSGKD